MTKKPFDIFDRINLSRPTDDEEPLSIWDRRDVYFVVKYQYIETLVYVDDKIANVSLWGHETRFGAPLREQEEGDSQYIASITFKKPGATLEPFRYNPDAGPGHENYMTVDLDIGRRDAIIDLLRNEGPVYVYAFHTGRPEREITWAWIGTSSCHPEDVGEGED